METGLNAAGSRRNGATHRSAWQRAFAPLAKAEYQSAAPTAANTKREHAKPSPGVSPRSNTASVGSSGLRTNRLAARRMTVHDGLLALVAAGGAAMKS